MSDVEALRRAQIEHDREAAARHEERLRRESDRAVDKFKTHVVCSYWYCRHEAWIPKTDRRRFKCQQCGEAGVLASPKPELG